MRFSSTTIIRFFVVGTCIANSGANINDDVDNAMSTAADAISGGVNTAIDATEDAAQTATSAVAGAADTTADKTKTFVENQKGSKANNETDVGEMDVGAVPKDDAMNKTGGEDMEDEAESTSGGSPAGVVTSAVLLAVGGAAIIAGL
mmetsp:Transcript_18313/g.20159  ORF Transcript_18313/g.20159 Transcript_18313/m.20159 type:complete len:147 (+) Transcript_18313:91-531(+)